MRNISKRHTKPCVYYQANNCPLSANECDYAHIIATPEQSELLKNPQVTLRTKPCRFYLAGQCKDGHWCRFKHPASVLGANVATSESDMRSGLRGLNPENCTDNSVDVRDLEGAWKAKPDQHPKYRTRPCRNYLLGKCVYGDRCSYLHASPSPSSSISSLSSPPENFYISTPPTSYFPLSPPPHRVPTSTPVSSGNIDVDMTGFDPSLLQQAYTGHRTRTPSNSSSHITSEPATPASPPTPGGNEYASFQQFPHAIPGFSLSPLAPFVFAKNGPVDNISTPMSPPYAMYSPTSPVPVRIVHVPIAVPMYQNLHCESRRQSTDTQWTNGHRQRAFSQPDVGPGNLSQSAYFRSKPCKFYTEFGRCYKGDNCNFIHGAERPPTYSDPECHQESVRLEQKESADEPTQSESTSPDAKSSNFYKINWRVVGGGVKIATNNSAPRRHSESVSTFSRRLEAPPVFKNPFLTSRELPHNGSSPLDAPFVLKERANSSCAAFSTRASHVPSGQSIQRSIGNALALTLQSYSIADAPARPVIVVQDDEDESHWENNGNRNDAEITTRDPPTLAKQPPVCIARAKSSPSSPVSSQAELPALLFSAESP
ncbi:hypothetical protein M0805_000854 [Coniferiporia weirii]|nr:hypothetical protein M0805_000854 [Coniferiporia weirii]